jgi:hypothetical protein
MMTTERLRAASTSYPHRHVRSVGLGLTFVRDVNAMK